MIPRDTISRIQVGDLVKFARHIELPSSIHTIGVVVGKDKERSTCSHLRWNVRWMLKGVTYSYAAINLRKVKDGLQTRQ
jgi:hypothetical protein